MNVKSEEKQDKEQVWFILQLLQGTIKTEDTGVQDNDQYWPQTEGDKEALMHIIFC